MYMSWSHTLLTTRTFAKMRSSSWRNRSTLTRSLRAPGPNPRQSICAKATCWSRELHPQLHLSSDSYIHFILSEGQWGSSVLLQHVQPGIHVADKLAHDCGQMLGFHQFWSQQTSFVMISMQKWSSPPQAPPRAGPARKWRVHLWPCRRRWRPPSQPKPGPSHKKQEPRPDERGAVVAQGTAAMLHDWDASHNKKCKAPNFLRNLYTVASMFVNIIIISWQAAPVLPSCTPWRRRSQKTKNTADPRTIAKWCTHSKAVREDKE